MRETLTMADPTVADPICPDPTHTHADDSETLAVPPLDPTFFDQDINFSFDQDFDFDIEDLDFTLEDLYFPSDTEDFLNFTSNPDSCCINQSISEQEIGDLSSDRVFDLVQSESCQVSGFENSDASDKNVSNQELILNLQPSDSPESENLDRDGPGFSSSQGSGNNCRSNRLESPNDNEYLLDSVDCARSHNSFDSANNSVNRVHNEEIRMEELDKSCLFKRKKESEDVTSEPRKRKHRRSIVDQFYESNPKNDEEEKKKARLIRNRESAHLSRERKKHYVGELEEKLRKMHSTVHDLNAKISYIMAENASLKQQLSGSGMYPHPPMVPMAYPWVPYTPYFVNPQSQVPLVPIPKLKPQPPMPAPKSTKVHSKKREGKTKKVASISFLGLLFFILLFGGLVPMVNVKYRDYIENKHYDQQNGRVGAVNGRLNGTTHNSVIGFSSEKKLGHGKEFTNSYCGRGQVGGLESDIEFSGSGNASEPLLASLYVPRNDTLVKIDGNLIIHSVMATEKAMAASKETSLAVASNMGPAISIQGIERNGRHPHMYKSTTEGQRALGSGSGDNLKSTAAEGELRKWFREGLTGPMLSSGMCTEVFHFDVLPSSPGSVIPATSAKNISAKNPKNSNKGRNRRVLHHLPPIPLPGSTHNITKERIGKENSHGKNNSLSSMVVSVLVDPRESSNEGNDGIMGKKSLSRVFVVLLLDGVKYVTYSCVIPLMGSTTNLVTT